MAKQKHSKTPALAAGAPRPTAPQTGPNLTDAERLVLAFDVACELDEILAGLRTWARRDASRNPQVQALVDRLDAVTKTLVSVAQPDCDDEHDPLALIDSLPHVDPDMRDRVASRIGRA